MNLFEDQVPLLQTFQHRFLDERELYGRHLCVHAPAGEDDKQTGTTRREEEGRTDQRLKSFELGIRPEEELLLIFPLTKCGQSSILKCIQPE